MANKRDRAQYETSESAGVTSGVSGTAKLNGLSKPVIPAPNGTSTPPKRQKKTPVAAAHLSPSAPTIEPTSLSSRAADPRLSPAPEGIYSATSKTPLPPTLKKYHGQRYTLFSNFDSNIWLTHNSWFEVTPECISNYLAERILGSSYEDDTVEPTQVIMDAFCGIGGNTLAFAAHPACKHVVAVDMDPVALRCLEHNARVFGLQDKITILKADFFKLADGTLEIPPTGYAADSFDAIFVSPPWGGPSYQEAGDSNGGIFDLELMEPYPFSAVYSAAKKVSDRMAFFLPRTSDLRQLADHSDGKKVRAVHCCVRAASKAICAFYGDVAGDTGTDVVEKERLVRN